jgi:dihydrofolate synthase/folylpolyglutamate synthase
MKTYEQVIDYIHSQLPMFHREGKTAYKANLDNTIAFDNHLGNPHQKFKTIHIAGTNGKGSVSHMLAAILKSQGYKTGLFTSPHLLDFRERVKINGEMISKDEIANFVNSHFSFIENIKPSFFEITVAIAFQYFAKEKVDIAVIETGLGGRLDCTNIINPLLSVITNISFDHTDILGKTIEAIAYEKAGIIKPNTPVVIGEWNEEYNHIFNKASFEKGCNITYADKTYEVKESEITEANNQKLTIYKSNEAQPKLYTTDLLGLYQQKNVPTVLCAIDALIQSGIKVSEQSIQSGLVNTSALTGLQGRWQILNRKPLTICDTGHNIAGISYVVSQLKQMKYTTLHYVFGMVSDKDINSVLALLPKNATYYFTKAQIPRALNEVELEKQAASYQLKGNCFATVSEAYNSAKKNATTDDLILIGGSTFIVAEALSLDI